MSTSVRSPSSSPSHNHRPGQIKNKKKHQHQKPRFQSENVADDHHGLAPPNEYPAPTEVIISDVTKERIRKREPTGFVGSGAHTTAEAAAHSSQFAHRPRGSRHGQTTSHKANSAAVLIHCCSAS